VHARRQAAAFLMTPDAVDRLFATVAPRYGDRNGGYLRIVKSGIRQGDAGEKAFIELLDAEEALAAKAQEREDARQKRREALQRQLEEQQGGDDDGTDDTGVNRK